MRLRLEDKEEFKRLRQESAREIKDMFGKLMEIFTTQGAADLESLDGKFTNRIEAGIRKLVQNVTSVRQGNYKEVSSVRDETEREKAQMK